MPLLSCLSREKIGIFHQIFSWEVSDLSLDIPDFFRGENPAKSRGKSVTNTSLWLCYS